MAGWEKVATTLNGCSAFKMHHLKGPIAKNRFERLVGRHRSWVKSGSKPEHAPSEDAAFQSVMMQLISKLDAAEAEPVTQTLGKRGRPRKVRSVEALDPVMKKLSPGPSHVAIAPSLLGPQPSSSTSLLVGSEDQALPIVTKATRQRFTPRDDLLLAKYVKQSLPFRAKFGAISAAWDDVATKLDSNPEFSKDSIKGPVVRYRFENLVSKYRERVKRNSGRVVGSKGTPAGELEVLMTELVTLLEGGDPVSAALLAQNVAIVTKSGNAVGERKLSRTSKSQDSTSTHSDSSSPSFQVSEVSPVAPRTIIAHMSDLHPMNTLTLTKSVTKPAVVNAFGPTSIAEVETLLQNMFEHQNRAIEQMVLLQREDRRLEAERRERELDLERKEREEREKERQVREMERELREKEFEKEHELREKEREKRQKYLKMERELREKEMEKERELREKERELRGMEREKEREEREKEREKDRQVLTATVLSAMKTFMEQNNRQTAEGQ
uniref:Myb-like domain-containing protein n=1 Tax=Hyaloperonospora arabidopsidis (strain Emoy2) TaxID=559515 RepID=M4BTB0_HYAAE